MEVKTCRRCKKIFQYIAGAEICQKCRQKEEDMFQVVKDYLRKNPGASMNLVSEETEVPVTLIESFLRQGRLEVSPGSPISLTCETCGEKITTGRYCIRCSNQLANELSGAAKEMSNRNLKTLEESTREKMRFLKSDRIK